MIEIKLMEYQRLHGFLCPAAFWPALGYSGEARYVAIWWEQCGDEASWNDGRSSFVGAFWPAYQELLGQLPFGHPAHWLLGGSDIEATTRLVIDRRTEWAWLVPAGEADEVLRLQYSVEDVAADGGGVTLTFEMLMDIVGNLPPRTAISAEDLAQMMVAEAAAYEELRQALARRAQAKEVSRGQ